MKLKNISARPHWLGNVMIAPLSIEEVGEEWRNAYNKADLEEVKEVVVHEAESTTTEEVEPVKRGRKPKAD